MTSQYGVQDGRRMEEGADEVAMVLVMAERMVDAM